MTKEDIKNIVKEIIVQANTLKHKYVSELAPVNYACIFCQNDIEYASFLDAAKQIGRVIKETPGGPLFQIEPLSTIAGNLQLLKIRQPDPTKPERGDADFTLSNYDEFKSVHLTQKGFKLINKIEFEMIELMDPDYNVRVYFSNPPLDKQLGIT
ncbi:MAG: hypothetical protein WC734_00980 [Patescibacteria group bacterium]|jgi:hypothetical protein